MISLTLLACLVPFVTAHGYLNRVVIDGKKFQGSDVPKLSNTPSIIRAVNSIDPVKGANNPDVNCGASAKKAVHVAEAKPGSKLEFHWESGEDTNWPHNTGSVLTYMASCGEQSCAQFDSTQAKWFKIHQEGIVSKKGESPVVWAQAAIMTGKPSTVTLPSNIAPGNYLVRHELIALQLADSQGGAEFYPACTQLKISGSGTGKPKDSELVSFPGAYKDTDPGILDTNVFEPGHTYSFPGPAVAAFVNDSGASDSSSSESTPSLSSSAAPQSTSKSKAKKPCKRSGGSKRMVKKRELITQGRN